MNDKIEKLIKEIEKLTIKEISVLGKHIEKKLEEGESNE